MTIMMMIVENCGSVWLVSGYAHVFIQLFRCHCTAPMLSIPSSSY